MLDGARLSQLIGAIYDCALEPQRWPQTLEVICAALGFRTSGLTLVDLRDRSVPINVTSGVEERWHALMQSAGPLMVEMWGGPERVRRLPVEEPLVPSAHVDMSVLHGSDYWRDWAQPLGLADQLVMILRRDDDLLSTIGLGRHGDDGPIGREETEGARLLAPICAGP
jgi:hypothetical protein